MKNIKIKTIVFLLTIILALPVIFACAETEDVPALTGNISETQTPNEKQYLQETPVKIDNFPDNDDIYIGYTVNSKRAGKVSGGAIRKLSDEEKIVEAVPNFGYKFVRWSDGNTNRTRSDSLKNISEDTVITAIFDYDVLDMPIIAIDTETGHDVKSKTEYIGAKFAIYAAGKFDMEPQEIQIRGRGNNTWSYEKKSYKMRFQKKVNLFNLGMAKDRVWVMLANVCDQSLQRNHVALELARSLSGIEFSPASISVEVFLNGEYRGVYLVAEEIRDSRARVWIDTRDYMTDVDIGYLVELSGYSDKETFYVAGKLYQVHSDLSENRKTRQKQVEFIRDYMEKALEAVRSGDRKKMEKYIDFNSLIDTYLVEEVVKNLDTGWDSYYLYKNKGGKLHFGPIWDFDLSLGNADSGAEFYEGLFTALPLGSGGGNQWYYLSMKNDWFRELVVKRWDEIKETKIYTIPQSVIDEGSQKIRSYERNFIRWPIFGTRQNRETEFIRVLKNYREHYEYLAEWAQNRIDWLDEIYHLEDFTTMRLMKGGSAEEADYADDETKKLMESKTNFIEKIGVKNVRCTNEGFGGEEVHNLFDSYAGTKYCYKCYGESEFYFETKERVKAEYYAFMTANDTAGNVYRNPQKWKIYGSNDGSSWELMADVKDGRSLLTKTNFTWHVFKFDNTAAYKYFKVWIENDDIVQFAEMALLN
ncbi:MAG: hypothetical protein GX897_10895 [Clostridiales bacterium]|nr:hypothetical protein [Clostridiales bacterium]